MTDRVGVARLERGTRRDLDAIGALAGKIASDDTTALERVRLTHELGRIRADLLRRLVAAARHEGATWQEIGDRLDIPRQTAHRRYRP